MSRYQTPQSSDEATKQYFKHSTAPRINTDAVIVQALTHQYPNLQLTIVPEASCNLLSYAAAGNATYSFLGPDSGDTLPASLKWTLYFPPARRIDGDAGTVAESMVFGKMSYRWQDHDFIIYLVDGRDGMSPYPRVTNYYVLSAEKEQASSLVLQAGRWSNELHEEVWVFDGGYWDKSRDLYESVRHASWDNVILDPAMKKALIQDHLNFFDSRETYAKLKVPWKRGILTYGPPGNGKTISIKAMMHTLYSRDEPIPTLYVRSLTSFAGPEYSVSQIFSKARQFAPCYLVLEDLDTIVSDGIRSYFLNEVDGLKSNDGIFMVGSTNHLDRLDPGISKRPSRFDRKYLFPDPDLKERVAYCKFWQGKLGGNKEIEFPDKLCDAIAEITDKFSFAYMQEAFVAALLAIASRSGDDEDSKSQKSSKASLTEELEDDWVGIHGEDDIDDLVLWVEIQKQVKILREGMEENK